MPSAIKDKIVADMKEAMKAQQKERLLIIRLMLAAFKQREVDERIVLEDADVIAILEKMIKQRRESIAQFQQANRQDLVDQEQFELELIQPYLPEQLSSEEVSTLVKAAVTSSGAASIKDMGKVMAIVKPQLQGRADMSKVGELVKSLLS